MFKYLFCLVISICLVQISFGQLECSAIKWSEKIKLNWSNYKSKSDSSSEFEAISNLLLDYDFKYSDDSLHIFTWSSFNPCKSWTKDTTAINLLLHERIHFDILEYFRRHLIKKIQESNFSKKSFDTTLESIYADIKKQENLFQSKYDEETNFSINKNEQIKWKKKIDVLLLSMKRYDKTVIDLVFR